MGNIGGSAVSLEIITLINQGLPPIIELPIKIIKQLRRYSLSSFLKMQLEIGLNIYPIEAHLLHILEITDNKRD